MERLILHLMTAEETPAPRALAHPRGRASASRTTPPLSPDRAVGTILRSLAITGRRFEPWEQVCHAVEAATYVAPGLPIAGARLRRGSANRYFSPCSQCVRPLKYGA